MGLSLEATAPEILHFGYIVCIFLFLVPLKGAVIRLRANYTPKQAQGLEHARVAADVDRSSEQAQCPSRLPVLDVLQMMARTVHCEGWTRLWAGAVPTVAQVLIKSLLHQSLRPHDVELWRSPEAQELEGISDKLIALHNPPIILLFTLISLVMLPFQVLSVRAIVNQDSTSWLAPRTKLRKLLTPAERKHLWLLYTLPGLLPTRLLLDELIPRLSLIGESITLECMEDVNSRQTLGMLQRVCGNGRFHWLAPLLRAFWVLCCAVVVCILETILIRLIVQSLAQKQRTRATIPNSANSPNGVIGIGATINLRRCTDPGKDKQPKRKEPTAKLYTGTFDCASKMCSEEGVESLCRAMWMTSVCWAYECLALD